MLHYFAYLSMTTKRYPLYEWSNEEEEEEQEDELKQKDGGGRELQEHYCINHGELYFFLISLWAAMERLGSVQSRGVPLSFYSPSSTESAKRGENGQLVSNTNNTK